MIKNKQNKIKFIFICICTGTFSVNAMSYYGREAAAWSIATRVGNNPGVADVATQPELQTRDVAVQTEPIGTIDAGTQSKPTVTNASVQAGPMPRGHSLPDYLQSSLAYLSPADLIPLAASSKPILVSMLENPAESFGKYQLKKAQWVEFLLVARKYKGDLKYLKRYLRGEAVKYRVPFDTLLTGLFSLEHLRLGSVMLLQELRSFLDNPASDYKLTSSRSGAKNTLLGLIVSLRSIQNDFIINGRTVTYDPATTRTQVTSSEYTTLFDSELIEWRSMLGRTNGPESKLRLSKEEEQYILIGQINGDDLILRFNHDKNLIKLLSSFTPSMMESLIRLNNKKVVV